MIVGICKLDILLDGHHSLKEKRKILRKIKDSSFSKFKIPVSEVDHQDLWQRTGIGFAIVGNDQQKLNSIIDKMINHIHNFMIGDIVDLETEYVYLKGREY